MWGRAASDTCNPRGNEGAILALILACLQPVPA
jgi:hypothetical protein